MSPEFATSTPDSTAQVGMTLAAIAYQPGLAAIRTTLSNPKLATQGRWSVTWYGVDPGNQVYVAQDERASQMARDTAAREHKEHVGQLRSAEQEAAAQRARADALENQLERQGTLMRSLSPVTRRSGTKKKINTVDPLAELREDFEALVARMQTPEHKAGVDALFAATGKEIGANAQTYARTANAPPRAKKNIRNRRGSVN